MGRVYVDIDGTLAQVSGSDYLKAEPEPHIIELVNRYYDEGYEVVVHTARGTMTGIDWYDVSKEQLDRWGVKYHRLEMGKAAWDIYIGDKVINVRDLHHNASDKIVLKKWGHESWIMVNELYAAKYLYMTPGKNTSRQYHEKKDETMRVVYGDGVLELNGEDIKMTPGKTVRIKAGDVHQLHAHTNLCVLEVSTPELDDVVRLGE